MTLFRHLTWLVLFFSFLIQFGSASLFIWHNQTTIYENNQNQAQNTAEFLINTLSVSNQFNNAQLNPATALQQLTNPLIESGQYKTISILQNNQTIYTQELPLIIDAVPNWFTQKFGVQNNPVSISRRISDQEVQVIVEMNIEKTNYNLYRTVKNAAQWVLIGMIATSIALFYSLKRLLSPLNELEEHAKAISHRQFDHQIPLPKTRELQEVVLSMNHMSTKLHQLFNEQLDIIQQARTLAYEDHLTHLPNASAFENRIKLVQYNEEETHNGFIILAKLEGLTQENKASGRQQTDISIKKFSDIWKQQWTKVRPLAFSARHSSSEFLTWIPTKNYDEIHKVILQVNSLFLEQKSENKLGKNLNLHMSLYYLDHQNREDWNGIYERLVQNVQEATENKVLYLGPDCSQIKTSPSQSVQQNQQNICTGDICQTEREWSELLTQTISTKNIVLKFQPLAYLQTESLNVPDSECFMRLPFQDRLMTGAQIWPVIDELGLTYAFDRLVIQMSLVHLNDYPRHKLSLNISNTTLEHEEFTSWLGQLLKNYPDLVDCLYFDIKESFIESPFAIEKLVELKAMGISIILDQTIARKSTIDNFVRLPISAIKMNVQFLKQARFQPYNESSDSVIEANHPHHQYLFITNLTTLCRSCDVAVIIDGIESEEDSEIALEFKPTAVQGFYIAEPLSSYEECLGWNSHHRFEDQAS